MEVGDVSRSTEPLDLNSFRDENVSYEDLRARYRLTVPAELNIADVAVTRNVRIGRGASPALDYPDAAARATLTFAELDRLAGRFAAALARFGVARGDRVVVYAAQGLAAALTHLGCYRLGAIVAPLSTLYGPDTVRHAIAHSGARVAVVDPELWQRVTSPDLEAQVATLISTGDAFGRAHAFADCLDATAAPAVAATRAADPALLLYTSGSTGMPKGILLPHRLILGYLPSVSLFYQLEMNLPGMRLWTPSDWSWIAGIVNVMLTGWYFGQTVVAGQGRFSAAWVFEFLQANRVTHTFLTPTALKKMAEVPAPRTAYPQLALRAIGTGGEPLPGATLAWGSDSLGVPINEFYGLTEVNHLVGNCQRLYPVRAGSMGRAYPGHVVDVVDERGEPVAPGTLGEIVARSDDPTAFLGYWHDPDKTAAMRLGPWLRTGDYGTRDADGYFWYHGRNDDLIKSAGYRIGPAEVEDALIRHPAVAEAAVVGAPDPDRGQIVIAFVRLAPGHGPSDALAGELQQHVKDRLAVYKYPRVVRFVDEFPLTSTGKISRKTLRSQLEAQGA
jgi:acetyl-CoA synthetase